MKLFYNPRCSTCRTSLKILEEKGKKVEIIKYLEEKPTKEDLKEILKMLNIPAIDLIRKKESIWKENYKDKNLNEQEIIEIMEKKPILIERPIFINEGKAIIGRPAEKVMDIL